MNMLSKPLSVIEGSDERAVYLHEAAKAAYVATIAAAALPVPSETAKQPNPQVHGP